MLSAVWDDFAVLISATVIVDKLILAKDDT